jgi:hypothetical protein
VARQSSSDPARAEPRVRFVAAEALALLRDTLPMPAPETATTAAIRRALQDVLQQLTGFRPTMIYPGHDYIENNLRFTLDREPDNRDARQMLDRLTGQDPSCAYVSTLEVERRINTFFRLTSPTVIAKLREAFPDLPDKPDQRTVFLKLRELRNSW